MYIYIRIYVHVYVCIYIYIYAGAKLGGVSFDAAEVRQRFRENLINGDGLLRLTNEVMCVTCSRHIDDTHCKYMCLCVYIYTYMRINGDGLLRLTNEVMCDTDPRHINDTHYICIYI